MHLNKTDFHILYRFMNCFSTKITLFLHYFFTIFHYFIVLASELSNARISGFAMTFVYAFLTDKLVNSK